MLTLQTCRSLDIRFQSLWGKHIDLYLIGPLDLVFGPSSLNLLGILVLQNSFVYCGDLNKGNIWITTASCSKLLEIVVCEQTTKFIEEEKILPPNQHGFRAKHSTMTAWSDIQGVWAKSSEQKETTGILLWDLSAAIDTLDHGILCRKLEIYIVQKEKSKNL